MAEHSPEPWEIRPFPKGMEFDGFRIVDGQGHDLATVLCSSECGRHVGEGLANAERIVACVNFCKGLEAESLNPHRSLPEVLVAGVGLEGKVLVVEETGPKFTRIETCPQLPIEVDGPIGPSCV